MPRMTKAGIKMHKARLAALEKMIPSRTEEFEIDGDEFGSVIEWDQFVDSCPMSGCDDVCFDIRFNDKMICRSSVVNERTESHYEMGSRRTCHLKELIIGFETAAAFLRQQYLIASKEQNKLDPTWASDQYSTAKEIKQCIAEMKKRGESTEKFIAAPNKVKALKRKGVVSRVGKKAKGGKR